MGTFVALDFETADRGRDSACAIGIVRVEHNQIVNRDYYLIRPPRQTFEFTEIHGIRWSDVAHEPTFGQLWPKIDLLSVMLILSLPTMLPLIKEFYMPAATLTKLPNPSPVLSAPCS
jgi:hypothetical protein